MRLSDIKKFVRPQCQLLNALRNGLEWRERDDIGGIYRNKNKRGV